MEYPYEQMRTISRNLNEIIELYAAHGREIAEAAQRQQAAIIKNLPDIINVLDEVSRINSNQLVSQLDYIRIHADEINQILISQSESVIEAVQRIGKSISGQMNNLHRHVNFLSSIFQHIDLQRIEEYLPETDLDHEKNEDEDESNDARISRPVYFDTAIKLTVIVNVVDEGMDKPDIAEDASQKWKRYVKPVIGFLITVLLTWAMSSTPLRNMNIVNSVEKVVHMLEQYDVPEDD